MNNQSVLVTGMILRITPYREHDHLLHVLTQNDEYLTFIVRGSQKTTSKNAVGGLAYAIVEFEYLKKGMHSTMHILKNRKVKRLFQSIYTDIEKQLFVHSIQGLFMQFQFQEDGHSYQNYEQFVRLLNDENKNNFYFASMLAYLIRLYGVQPNVDACIKCNSKHYIASFQIHEGGFGCLHCYSKNANKEHLQQIRYIFKQQMNFHYLPETDISDALVNTIVEYTECHLHTKISNYQLVQKINSSHCLKV